MGRSRAAYRFLVGKLEGIPLGVHMRRQEDNITMDFEEIESGLDSSGLDWKQVADPCE